MEAVVWVLRIVVGGAFLDPRSILVAVVWVFRNIVEAVNFLELCIISSSMCHTILVGAVVWVFRNEVVTVVWILSDYVGVVVMFFKNVVVAVVWWWL